MTWFLQRAIIGLEAYIPTATFLAAVHYGRMNADIVRAQQDPFSLRAGSTVNTYYNALPRLVDDTFPLKRARNAVWKNVNKFYEQVRNPLFHGSELYTDGHRHADTLDSVLRAFELFVAIYDWVDWWLPPNLRNMYGTIAISEPPIPPHPSGG